MTIWTPIQAYTYAYQHGLNFPVDAMITPHFKWSEAFANEKGDVPCIWVFNNLLKPFTELEKLRVKLGLSITITRAYSSVQHNKDAGSTATLSCHLLGLAIDFVVNGLSIANARTILVSRKEIKVRIENGTPTWLHIDTGNPYIVGGMKLGCFNP